MSRELSPLEAFRKVKFYAGDTWIHCSEWDIIETALKENIKLHNENCKLVDEMRKLKDDVAGCRSLENKLLVEWKENEKKLKALEIIKEKEVDVSCLLFDGLELYNEYMHPSRVITQEEHSLIMEVLKSETK